jgi:hypothetical protein
VSDVFSLGVLLHELLAGSLPMSPDAGPGGRSLSGAEPIPLSVAAARAGDGRGAGAVEPEARRLAGYLDAPPTADGCARAPWLPRAG